MEKILFLSVSITVLFFIAKIAEMKYIEKEMKPLKFIIRDSMFVFLCSFLPLLMFFQFDSQLNEFFKFGEDINQPSQIFTDEPGF